MRPSPWLLAEPHRLHDVPGLGSHYGDRFGCFRVKFRSGAVLYCMVTDGVGGLGPEFEWEHVSVSTAKRCPNWYEMDFVKDLFWAEDECVMQLHVPKAEHRNIYPHVLHLWRPRNVEIPRPPAEAV